MIAEHYTKDWRSEQILDCNVIKRGEQQITRMLRGEMREPPPASRRGGRQLPARGHELTVSVARLEVHAGKPGKDSKSEILLCSAPSRMYGDATTFDNVDLSDVQLPGGLSMPVVSKFKYLGDYVLSSGSDDNAVEARTRSRRGPCAARQRPCLLLACVGDACLDRVLVGAAARNVVAQILEL